MAYIQELERVLIDVETVGNDGLEAIEKFVADRLTMARHNLLRKHDKAYDYLFRTTNKMHEEYSRNLGMLIDKIGDESIIIYIEHIGNYILFSNPRKYYSYTYNTTQRDDDDDFHEYVRYQVVNASESHKMTLVCRKDVDAGTLQKIQKAIQEKFGVGSKIAYNKRWDAQQILTDLHIGNIQECQRRHDELCDYIDDSAISRNLSTPIVERDGVSNYKYIMPVISHTKNSCEYVQSIVNDLIAYNKHGASININMYVGNGVVNVNNTTQKRRNTHKWSREWIVANPPANEEPSGEYYNIKYLGACNAAHIKPMGIQELSKYVESLGYEKYRTNKKNYWLKSA